MGVLEIISSILLILCCVFIIILVIMQDSSKGMSQSITGATSDNYYQRNSGRSKEARLKRATKYSAIALFVVTLIVNFIAIYTVKNPSTDAPVETTPAIVEETTVLEDTSAEETTVPEDTTAAGAEDTTAAG